MDKSNTKRTTKIKCETENYYQKDYAKSAQYVREKSPSNAFSKGEKTGFAARAVKMAEQNNYPGPGKHETGKVWEKNVLSFGAGSTKKRC